MCRIDRPRSAQEFAEYFEFRWRVLRAPWNQPRGSERDEHEAVADHFAARTQGGRLVGIGRIHRAGPRVSRMRFVAVDPAYRGCGIGRAIVERLEAAALACDAELIVLDARDTVVGFYEALGYRVVGPGPTRFGALAHTRMEKRLPRGRGVEQRRAP